MLRRGSQPVAYLRLVTTERVLLQYCAILYH